MKEKLKRKYTNAENAPAAIGPYSQGDRPRGLFPRDRNDRGHGSRQVKQGLSDRKTNGHGMLCPFVLRRMSDHTIASIIIVHSPHKAPFFCCHRRLVRGILSFHASFTSSHLRETAPKAALTSSGRLKLGTNSRINLINSPLSAAATADSSDLS